MRILILGSQGMLGTELAKTFSEYRPVCWDRPDLDITDRKMVARRLKELMPQVVINAAAYTAVDDCEKNKRLARQVNGQALGYLAQACKKVGAILVHYSTDYVFAGRKKSGYTEKDKPRSPVNYYGYSKLLGEQAIQKYTDKFYLIRTSWLYGHAGKNFVATMLDLARKQVGTGRDLSLRSTQPPLRVVNDQFGKPTYAPDLAQRTREIWGAKLPFGIYHATNETRPSGISWYQFAREIFKQAGLKKKVQPCTSKEFPRPARRPHYSILVNTKLKPLRFWQKALADYLSDIDPAPFVPEKI